MHVHQHSSHLSTALIIRLCNDLTFITPRAPPHPSCRGGGADRRREAETSRGATWCLIGATTAAMVSPPFPYLHLLLVGCLPSPSPPPPPPMDSLTSFDLIPSRSLTFKSSRHRSYRHSARREHPNISPEIWAIILQHATAVPHDLSGYQPGALDDAHVHCDTTYNQALVTKRSLVLVSKLFCDIATPLLYESINLWRSTQVHQLAHVLATSAARHRVGFGWWTRKIKLFLFDFTGEVESSVIRDSLRRILDLTPRLVVYIDGNAGLPRDPPRPVGSALRRLEWMFGSGPDPECLASIVQDNPHLESLVLPGISRAVGKPLHAPRLKYIDLPLAVANSSAFAHWSILSQWSLPHLSHLTLRAHTLSESDRPAIEALEAFLDVHGGRITHLDLRFSCMMLPSYLSIDSTFLSRLPVLRELIFSMRYTPPLGPVGPHHPNLAQIGLRDFTPERCPSNDCRVGIIARHFSDLVKRNVTWPSLTSIRLLEADGVEFEKMPLIDASWWNHWIVSWRNKGVRFEDRRGKLIGTGRKHEWFLACASILFVIFYFLAS